MKKTPEQIAEAIKAYGEEANLASKFQDILDREVEAGTESDDREEVKAKVAEIMRKYRLKRLRRIS